MPTIRFEDTDEKYKKLAGDLLESLQLDPERWLEDKEFELAQEIRIDVFGMQVSVPAVLSSEEQWSCRIVKQNGSHRLMVGDYVWAADVAAGAVPEEAVAALPEDLEVLCLSNLPIENVDFVARLKQLTSLYLHWCKSLTDISALSELKQLTSLNLAVCPKTHLAR